MTVKFGNPLWFEDPHVVTPETRTAIQKIRDDRNREAIRNKAPLPNLTDGDLVADTSFGFWVAFFYAGYTTSGSRVWSGRSLKRVFPNASPVELSPQKIKKALEHVRRLRNRVMHHEPVWNRPNLAAAHAGIHRVIHWLDPQVEQLVCAIDRFPGVHAAGEQAFFSVVDQVFPDIP